MVEPPTTIEFRPGCSFRRKRYARRQCESSVGSGAFFFWSRTPVGGTLAHADDERRKQRARLSEPDYRTLDRVATGAATALGVPAIAITMLDGNQQVCIGAHGFDRADRTLFSSFCLEVAIASRPVIVQDARSRSATTRLAWGLDLVAYAGVPLQVLNGARMGAIGACLSIRRGWQDRDLAILRAFGDVASVVIELELQLARATSAYASLEGRTSEAAFVTAEQLADPEQRRVTIELDQGPINEELTRLLSRRD